jgi:hypothetical protein
MVNIVVIKPPPEGAFENNSEIWMQGPEPYTTKIVDVTSQAKLVENLMPDQWYDFYARAPANATGDAGVAVITINLPNFPQPNNPEPYDIWSSAGSPGSTPVRRAAIEGWSFGPIPAGQVGYVGSMLLASTTNTTQPPNPVPGGTGGGVGGNCLGFLPFPCPDLSFMTNEMWIIAGAATGLVVLAVVIGGAGGDD